MNSLTQLEGNLGFVVDASREGGETTNGGARALEETGWVLHGADHRDRRQKPEHRLYRGRGPGPVLAVTSFTDEAEAYDWPTPATSDLRRGSGRKTCRGRIGWCGESDPVWCM